jgi:hypothetical protein
MNCLCVMNEIYFSFSKIIIKFLSFYTDVMHNGLTQFIRILRNLKYNHIFLFHFQSSFGILAFIDCRTAVSRYVIIITDSLSSMFDTTLVSVHLQSDHQKWEAFRCSINILYYLFILRNKNLK